MATRQELTQQQKAQWSAAAPGWERSSEWLDRNSPDLVNWICDAAGMRPGHTVLDVACGAGQPSVVVAQFVPAPPPDPAAPGAFRLAPPGELERVLRSAGFSDISIEPRPLRLTYDSLEDYWRIQTDLAAPLRAALASIPPDRVEALK